MEVMTVEGGCHLATINEQKERLCVSRSWVSISLAIEIRGGCNGYEDSNGAAGVPNYINGVVLQLSMDFGAIPAALGYGGGEVVRGILSKTWGGAKRRGRLRPCTLPPSHITLLRSPAIHPAIHPSHLRINHSIPYQISTQHHGQGGRQVGKARQGQGKSR